MDKGMQGLVDKQHLAGVVTLVARHGKVVQHKAYGVQDLESGAPMQLDTIVRIYSMTKPITGVAMMMLYEEGKWKPSDPIAKHIPEFANLKVFAGVDANGTPILEAPAHPPTMGELMSHTAGFTYGLFGSTAGRQDVPGSQSRSARRRCRRSSLRMAKIRLLYQPGDALGLQRLGRYPGLPGREAVGQDRSPSSCATRIFDPLGMKDTAFFVPAEKLPRRRDDLRVEPGQGRAGADAARIPTSAGCPGCLRRRRPVFDRRRTTSASPRCCSMAASSTASRLLKPSTVEMMRTNVLSEQVLNSNSGISQARFSPAQGFGYDVAVVLDPAGGQAPGRQGQLLVVGHRRHLVLDRSDQRSGHRSASSSGKVACPAPSTTRTSRREAGCCGTPLERARLV